MDNILLNKIHDSSSGIYISESKPYLDKSDDNPKMLFMEPIEKGKNNFSWKSINSESLYITYKKGDIQIELKEQNSNFNNLFFKDGNIGIGRIPLYNYTVDIKIPTNTIKTGLHIGDGIYGFSLGNATSDGFMPQIIGIGSSKDDPGLYFLGKTNNNRSDIPAIIFDGRNIDNSHIRNRPILGVSSGSYLNYYLIIDENGRVGISRTPLKYNLEVSGSILSNNIILETSTGNIDLLDKINYLENKIKYLEKSINKIK